MVSTSTEKRKNLLWQQELVQRGQETVCLLRLERKSPKLYMLTEFYIHICVTLGVYRKNFAGEKFTFFVTLPIAQCVKDL